MSLSALALALLLCVGAASGATTTFTVASPANGATVSGTVHITGQAGSQWVNIVAYNPNNNYAKVTADVTPSNGAYSLTLDTTTLPNGAATIDVKAFSVPAGQGGGTSATITRTLTIANLAPTTFTVDSPADGATVSGTVQFTGKAGSQWVNVAVYDASNNYAKIGADTTPSNGQYSISVATASLPNGARTIYVMAFSVAAGQSGGTSTTTVRTLTVNNQAASNCWPTSGAVYFGADGHINQPGPYANVPLSQQIADLKNIFGNTPNTIFYRALDAAMGADVFPALATQLQQAGIIPIVSMVIYPDWSSFTSQTQAYNYAYGIATQAVQAAPNVAYWIIGNEWNWQEPIKSQYANLGLYASDWSGAASFPVYLGMAAGAIAGIRDHNPSAKIVGGANGGWTLIGFSVALANGLKNYNGRNLLWDYTNVHWYNDAALGGPPDAVGNWGLPDNYDDGQYSVYSLLASIGKPLFFDEFGSGDAGSPSSNGAAAGQKLVGLMNNFVSHSAGTSSSAGVVAGTIYQLYSDNSAYRLYDTSGSTSTISPQGQAVKNWIAQNGNPAGSLPAGCSGPLHNS
jgi:hypothetical protein